MTTSARCLTAAALAAWLSCPADAGARSVPRPAPAPAPRASLQEGAAPKLRAGTAGAAQQLTLFCDIEDEACGRLVVVLRNVLDGNAGEVEVTFRHLAPAEHAASRLAYRAALAAARQGRGWEMLDIACANADRLDAAGLRGMAAQLGLDLGRFGADAASEEVQRVLDEDESEAGDLHVEVVPALFLNGSRLPDVFTRDAIAGAVKKAGR